MRPITPTSLLDSICWSISEPTSTASIYTDSFSSEGMSEHHTPQFFDAKGNAKDSEASFANFTRPLTERFLSICPFPTLVKFSCSSSYKQCIISRHLFIYILVCSEKSEVIFRNSFLTILFPVDRFAEVGPSSRTFFSDGGFTCLRVLDHIYAFYQV